MIYVNPMMPGEGGRVVEAFPALGASVWLVAVGQALFGDGVGEPLSRGYGVVLLHLLLLLLLQQLLLLLFLLLLLLLLAGPVGVDPLMPRQGGGMVEALFAVVAHVGLVALLVHPLHGTPVAKALATWHGGVQVVLSQVDLVVSGKGGGVVEALAALGAVVGLSSGMDQLMFFQVALANKTLPALVAFVRLLAGVDPLVFPQRGGGGKALATLCAAVGFVAHGRRVGLLVLLKVGSGGEALPALATRVRLVARVELLVLLQMPSAHKALSALGTLVGLVLRVHLHVLS